MDSGALTALLSYLDTAQPNEWQQVGDWYVRRVAGGANNLVYRASGSAGEVAVKFCIKDARDRAGREFGALSALREAGLTLAPKPLLLERERYTRSVVVQEWLEGRVKSAPPDSDEDWEKLIGHYAELHRLTPKKTKPSLPKALFNAPSVSTAKQLVTQQLSRIPAAAYPEGLHGLIERFTAWEKPTWPEPRVALCRVDANITNFVQSAGYWRSVDWENSGWGDPAFELADLMSHPAYMEVPDAQWAHVAERYAQLTRDDVAERLKVYYPAMLVFWAARFALYLYEVPRGLDPRLVARPADWQADCGRKYKHYLERAHQQL